MRESSQERLKREAALADAAATAQESRAWKGEGGAVAGHYATGCDACSCWQWYCCDEAILCMACNTVAQDAMEAIVTFNCVSKQATPFHAFTLCKYGRRVYLFVVSPYCSHVQCMSDYFDTLSAGVVLAAAAKCDTPNVKGVPSSHRVAARPLTGEPKRQPGGQKASKADQPERLRRAASAEAAQSAASANAGVTGGRQASALPAASEQEAAEVPFAHVSFML